MFGFIGKIFWNPVIKAMVRYFAVLLASEAMAFAKQWKSRAIPVVIGLATSDLSNEEKRRVAFEKIKGFVKDSGMDAKDHFINFLIEAVIVELHSKKIL